MDETTIESAVQEAPVEQSTEEVANVSEGETGAEPVSQETEEASSTESGGHELKANERIQQEIGRRKAEEERARQLESRLNQLESSFKQQVAPDYIEITPQVQQQINNALANIEQQRIDAELEGDYLRAAQFRGEFDKILQGLAENDQRMKAAQQQQQKSQAEQAKVKAINERAEFFRQQNNIPQAQWDMANRWFADQVAQQPALGVQFREIADYQGPMAAVSWAVNYVDTYLGKAVREANEAREKSKTMAPGGTQQQNTGTLLNNVKSMRENAMRSGSTDDWAAYYAAKRQLQK